MASRAREFSEGLLIQQLGRPTRLLGRRPTAVNHGQTAGLTTQATFEHQLTVRLTTPCSRGDTKAPNSVVHDDLSSFSCQLRTFITQVATMSV